MAQGSLRNTTIKGVGWSFADNFINVGVTFVVSLILARLLSPEEYGLIGIISIFIAILNCIVDSGFSNALIRKKDADNLDYNTVFNFNLLFSVVLSLGLFLSAKAIGRFFNQAELVPLTRAMSSVVIINALAIIQRTILVRNIDFKTQTKCSLIASITSGLVGIIMAFCGCGVWSLVAQQIVRAGLNTLGLWIWNKWRPTLQFSWERFKSLFDYGWKLLVSSLIDTTWNQAYNMVIGKCYSAETLGLYTRAHQFPNLCSSNLTTVIQRVSFPTLSKIQDEKERLKSAYRRIIKITMLVTFVLVLGMAGSAKSMIQVLVGDKWLACVPFLQLICFQMMLYPLHALNLNMLQVQGRSDLFLKLEIIKKIIALVPLLLGIFVNIYWMLGGSIVTGCISYWLNAKFSGPFIDYSIKQQVSDIIPSFTIAIIMAAIVYAMSFIQISPFILFPLQIIVGATFVFLVCEKLQLEEYIEIKSIAKEFLTKFKNRK